MTYPLPTPWLPKMQLNCCPVIFPAHFPPLAPGTNLLPGPAAGKGADLKGHPFTCCISIILAEKSPCSWCQVSPSSSPSLPSQVLGGELCSLWDPCVMLRHLERCGASVSSLQINAWLRTLPSQVIWCNTVTFNGVSEAPIEV